MDPLYKLIIADAFIAIILSFFLSRSCFLLVVSGSPANVYSKDRIFCFFLNFVMNQFKMHASILMLPCSCNILDWMLNYTVRFCHFFLQRTLRGLLSAAYA